MMLKWKFVKIVFTVIIITVNSSGGIENVATEGYNQLRLSKNEHNVSITPRDGRQVKFEEDTPYQTLDYSNLNEYNVREPGKPFKFQNDDSGDDNRVGFKDNDGFFLQENSGVTFKEDNAVRDHRVKKKKRRKRKPRLNSLGFQPYPASVGLPGALPANPYPGYGLFGAPIGQYH
ncbi:hypothetical protein ACJJTC_013312, partial [Scirpophaga incertulas]